ncbi:hypothetical protein P7K49_035522, partial [Saguinus oedipus]
MDGTCVYQLSMQIQKGLWIWRPFTCCPPLLVLWFSGLEVGPGHRYFKIMTETTPCAMEGLSGGTYLRRSTEGLRSMFGWTLPGKDVEEKPEQPPRTRETDKSPARTEPRQQPSALFARGNRKAVKSPQRPSSKIKENKHPFALYGWGEKQTDTGSQKTHNVCASAPVHEIHESALRAKNRRQVEKRKLVAQRQRAHSVDVENRKMKASSSENPWMTEYM